MLERYFNINWIDQKCCNGILISSLSSSLYFSMAFINVVFSFEADLEGSRFSMQDSYCILMNVDPNTFEADPNTLS